MGNVSSTVQSAPIKLAVMTAAISAGFAGEANAAWISTAPAGFTPQTVSTTGGSFSFDVNGDSIIDYTITGGNGSIILDGLSNNASDTLLQNVWATTSPDIFTSPGSVKLRTAPPIANTDPTTGIVSSWFETTPKFGQLVLDPDGSFTRGYIEGTIAINGEGGIDTPQTADFTLQDFGLLKVPEPTSLALLASGVVGIGAFRRRRRAKPN